MKKILGFSFILLIGLFLVGCKKDETKTIKVGISFQPMRDILELISDDLKNEGYKLEIVEQALEVNNIALKDNEIDANMIQHQYYLNLFNSAHNTNLVVVQNIYHAIYALYSKDYKNIDEIPNGANITLPDDASNTSRALYLLGQANLLTFKDNKKVNLTINDILENKKNLTFNEMVPLTSIAQKYNETRLAVMYPTYARSLNLVGDAERLFVEKQDDVTKDYAISLVARENNKDSEKLEILKKYLRSDEVRTYLINEYGYASTPAF